MKTDASATASFIAELTIGLLRDASGERLKMRSEGRMPALLRGLGGIARTARVPDSIRFRA
jgi:hypothetical protein